MMVENVSNTSVQKHNMHALQVMIMHVQKHY